MPAAKTKPADVVALLVSQGAALRAAGVRRLKVADVEVEFDEGGLLPVAPRRDDFEPDLDEVARQMDPLLDPVTYGRRDGKVPGFRRPPRAEEDDA